MKTRFQCRSGRRRGSRHVPRSLAAEHPRSVSGPTRTTLATALSPQARRLPRLAPAPLQCSQPITLYADWEAPAGRCRVSSGPDGSRQPGPRDTMKNADAHLPSLAEQTMGSSEAQRMQLGP